MAEYRLYIDESGDHTYRQLGDPHSRYLGLTGVLLLKKYYDDNVPDQVEALKRKHLRYDPDRPPILVRSHIRYRKYAFGILQDPERNQAWEADVLSLFRKLKGQIFTVVIDKKVHREAYPVQTFDPYVYCLAVLLWRVRGYLRQYGGDCDVLAESRGKVEDAQIQDAYKHLRNYGWTEWGTAEGYTAAFPDDAILFRKKEHNVAGLQIADLVAYGQKAQTIAENNKPLPRELSQFTAELNRVAGRLVNRYGRYLLE